MASHPLFQSSWIFEECWALQKWRVINRDYPWLSWKGMINESELEAFEKKCHHQESSVASFDLLAENCRLQLLSIKKSLFQYLQSCFHDQILPKLSFYSHAPTRWSYQWINSRLEDDCLIVLVDAHDDLGENRFISNRWLLPQWASNCILVGNWAEGVDVEDANAFLLVVNEMDELWNSLNAKKRDITRFERVFVSIDLDYWPHPKKFPDLDAWRWAISNYWTRELLVGHGRTILQLIQLQDSRSLQKMDHVGQVLFEWFEHVEEFQRWRRKCHREVKECVWNDVQSLFSWIEDLSLRTCYVDIVEYSPLFDVDYMTKQLIMKIFELVD